MAVATPRIGWQNWLRATASTVATSSERSGNPTRWLKDQLRSKAWVSKPGWNVSRLFNDSLDFREVGPINRVAFPAVGNYATGADLATQVQTSMNAAGLWPGDLSPTAWWVAGTMVTSVADGGLVSSWSDTSGNSRHVAQGNSSKQPKLIWNQLNGHPVIRFDGTDDYLAIASALSAFVGANGVRTVFIVYRADADLAGTDWLLSDTNSKIRFQHTTTNFVHINGDGSPDTSTLASSLGAYHIGMGYYDNTNVGVTVDNVDSANTAASGATNNVVGTLNVGCDDVFGNTFKGDIAEIIFFNSALSAENRRRISRYLSQKYAITDASTAPAFGTTYTVSYASNALTVSAGANFQLMFSTGPNVTRGVAKDLGFSAADTAAAASAAGSAVYCSREWITLDAASALGVSLGAITDHNLSGSSTLKLQGNSTPLTYLGHGASTGTSKTLTGDSTLQLLYFGTETYRYWRLLIDDTANTAGYVSIGNGHVGPYTEFSDGYSIDLNFGHEQLSSVMKADQGAHYVDAKPEYRAWGLLFPIMSDADKVILESIQSAVLLGKTFFVSLDPTADTTKTYYVSLPAKIDFKHEATSLGSRWNAQVKLEEALG